MKFNNDNYKDTVLQAVNLGSDTDTTAAVVGGLAGIYYGFNDICESWINDIVKGEMIKKLIKKGFLSNEEIANSLDMPLEEVQRIAAQTA